VPKREALIYLKDKPGQWTVEGDAYKVGEGDYVVLVHRSLYSEVVEGTEGNRPRRYSITHIPTGKEIAGYKHKGEAVRDIKRLSALLKRRGESLCSYMPPPFSPLWAPFFYLRDKGYADVWDKQLTFRKEYRERAYRDLLNIRRKS